MSQQGVKAEFTEDTENADANRVSGRPTKERRESHLCSGSGEFY